MTKIPWEEDGKPRWNSGATTGPPDPPYPTSQEDWMRRRWAIAARTRIGQGEKELYPHLKKLGFRWQYPHRNVRAVLDFYHHDHRIAVEVDGAVHQAHYQKKRDTRRDALLAEHGVLVLRFTVDQAILDTMNVIRLVERAVESAKRQEAAGFFTPSEPDPEPYPFPQEDGHEAPK